MIVPKQIPLSTVPAGGVFTVDGSFWYMQTTTTDTQVDLATGTVAAAVNPTTPVNYFPGAHVSV